MSRSTTTARAIRFGAPSSSTRRRRRRRARGRRRRRARGRRARGAMARRCGADAVGADAAPTDRRRRASWGRIGQTVRRGYGSDIRVMVRTPRDECRPLAKSEVTPRSGIIFFIFFAFAFVNARVVRIRRARTLSASRAIAPKRTENARRTRAEHARRADRASKARDGRARRRARARCYNDDTFVTTPARRGWYHSPRRRSSSLTTWRRSSYS